VARARVDVAVFIVITVFGFRMIWIIRYRL
jgi:hypothetical protein